MTNMVRDDLKLPDESGEVSKSEHMGWRFNSRLWNSSQLDGKIKSSPTARLAINFTLHKEVP